ncbi:hypothetical protein MNBD_UNCLBAC01-1326 [hydrothermal vent metagenome]|uniref:Lipoprotein n=1 Tax=hydrothermal vent metagenome TaxID=652676 RepID=A0A3B1DJ12_9ZZZZ
MLDIQKLNLKCSLLFCIIILSSCSEIETCENNAEQLKTIININWYTTDLDYNNLGLNFSNETDTSTIFHPKPFRQGTIKMLKDTIIFTPTTFFKTQYETEKIIIVKKCPNELILEFEDGSVYFYFQ